MKRHVTRQETKDISWPCKKAVVAFGRFCKRN